ncbi:MAG: VWA domain-containing protein [Proteobacteria bacterium]|nr:VWA domain-containing protein [Pseudomonadota bacterium]
MAKGNKTAPTPRQAGGEVDAFLQRLAAAPVVRPAGTRGRLIFAMDATASREPTWDRACRIQGEMFRETDALGGLEVQMAHFRGFGEFAASEWVSRPEDLIRRMTAVRCLGGATQIEKVLRHALAESRAGRVNAVVFVGDCMEEDADVLCHLAGELGIRGVPVFVFQEGGEPLARTTFQQIARLSRGAWCRFDSSSARQLRDLLSAVAVYAAGGRKALQDFGKTRSGDVLRIARQLG